MGIVLRLQRTIPIKQYIAPNNDIHPLKKKYVESCPQTKAIIKGKMVFISLKGILQLNVVI